MVASPQPVDLQAQINALRRQLNNLINSPRGNLGNFSNVGLSSGSLGTFYPRADGSPQVGTVLIDDAGHWRLVLADVENPSAAGRQVLIYYDQEANIVFSGDEHGGLATPWLSVPMYPRFVPNGQPTSYSANGWGFGYSNLSTSGNGVTSGMVIWEGRIPFVSHPWIQVDGVWGTASGTAAPTYNLVIAGIPVATFTPGSLTNGTWGLTDISATLAQHAVQVQITASWTGSGAIATDCLGVYLRQT